MTILDSRAVVPVYSAVHPITPARQAHVELYHENTRNGFRFVGYGPQKEDETYGPGGRSHGMAGRRGVMVDIYI